MVFQWSHALYATKNRRAIQSLSAPVIGRAERSCATKKHLPQCTIEIYFFLETFCGFYRYEKEKR
jgi:hypothetical protein